MTDKKIVLNCLVDIQNEWEEKGLELVSTSLGWRFQTKQELSTFIQKLQPEKSTRYSRAMMETLAIIAYRQPVTRADIESIRGVNVSSQIIRNLEEKNWIECVGQKEVLGKPSIRKGHKAMETFRTPHSPLPHPTSSYVRPCLTEGDHSNPDP